MTQHPEGPDRPADDRQESDVPGAPEQGAPHDQPAQPGQPNPYGQPGQAGPNQYGQPGQPNQYGQPGQPNQYGQPQQPWVPQQGQQQYGQQQYGQQQYGQGGAPTGAPLSQSDERLWGTLAHISIPFIGFVGPLVAYLVFKDRSPWLKATSTEALNFSILYTVVQFICGLLTSVVIGAILLPLVFIAGIVLCILAAIAANKGEQYKYPVNWRLIK